MLALIALVGSLSLLDFGSLLDRAATPSPLETLTAAVDAARSGALNAGAPTRLLYDAQSGSLRLHTGAASRDFAFATPAGVTFTLPADAAEGAERPLEALVFHPSGCALPAAIELTVGAERSSYRLEPFSGALTREESR